MAQLPRGWPAPDGWENMDVDTLAAALEHSCGFDATTAALEAQLALQVGDYRPDAGGGPLPATPAEHARDG